MCCELEEMAIQMAKNQQRAGGENSPLVRSLGRLIERRADGIEGLLARLRAQGLGVQVASWVDFGVNLPACPRSIRAALGEDFYELLRRRLNLEEKEAERILAEALPAAINKLTPNGCIEPRQENAFPLSFLGRLLGACRGQQAVRR